MTAPTAPADVVELVRTVRQIRQFYPDPIPESTVDTLLEIARWTGSSRNTQPWHFILVNDKRVLKQVSEVRTPINWVADAAIGIALVFNGETLATEAYDEGRVTERVLIVAKLFGFGGGVAWYGDSDQQANAKRILGIPEHLAARSIVAIGKPITIEDPRPNRVEGGRKPRSEVVSVNRY